MNTHRSKTLWYFWHINCQLSSHTNPNASSETQGQFVGRMGNWSERRNDGRGGGTGERGGNFPIRPKPTPGSPRMVLMPRLYIGHLSYGALVWGLERGIWGRKVETTMRLKVGWSDHNVFGGRFEGLSFIREFLARMSWGEVEPHVLSKLAPVLPRACSGITYLCTWTKFGVRFSSLPCCAQEQKISSERCVTCIHT